MVFKYSYQIFEWLCVCNQNYVTIDIIIPLVIYIIFSKIILI